MLEAYINMVTANPLGMAAIQFAILGTLGEVASFSAVNRRFALPCNQMQLALKAVAWAVLGIVVKYGFVGVTGFADALLDHGLLPSFLSSGLGRAFLLSFCMQAVFGPQIMYFHRLEDNLILRQWNFSGMETALKALVWFWLPAHTITFMLDKPLQIGLAAAFSVALGFILGFAKSRAQKAQMSQAAA
ncbi:hypothetical protein [Dethiosulfatarculus sandiegensis]|uniref:Uncharacterized protein n=1 Tax=Dethiosulfatarculus sandiegensis TaxID=1429043 RepID=A0A0D2JPZ3_9BACT|nr:hypothetical protein [Dethiosulfatarculus sandiegensis]KIX11530.1 hypothetical protein X474_23860 [Dethiosulfatarculus sandiegensis]